MPTRQNWTLEGNPNLEALLDRTFARASKALSEILPPSWIRSILVVGSYGRGEGGMVLRGGEARPRNNLDLLWLHRPHKVSGEVLRAAKEALTAIAHEEDLGVGIDLGLSWDFSWTKGFPSVFRVDVTAGHRVLLGDSEFVAKNPRHQAKFLHEGDFVQLAVNRATPLLINQALLWSDKAPAEEVTRHGIKALIGVADLILGLQGKYTPSYRARRGRTAQLRARFPGLAAWVRWALDARSKPCPSTAPFTPWEFQAKVLDLVTGVFQALRPELGQRLEEASWFSRRRHGLKAALGELDEWIFLAQGIQLSEASKGVDRDLRDHSGAEILTYLDRWSARHDCNYQDLRSRVRAPKGAQAA